MPFKRAPSCATAPTDSKLAVPSRAVNAVTVECSFFAPWDWQAPPGGYVTSVQHLEPGLPDQHGRAVPAEVLEASRAHAEFIRNETLARRFEIGSRLHEADLTQDVDLDGRRVTLSTRRYEASHGSARPQPTGK